MDFKVLGHDSFFPSPNRHCIITDEKEIWLFRLFICARFVHEVVFIAAHKQYRFFLNYFRHECLDVTLFFSTRHRLEELHLRLTNQRDESHEAKPRHGAQCSLCHTPMMMTWDVSTSNNNFKRHLERNIFSVITQFIRSDILCLPFHSTHIECPVRQGESSTIRAPKHDLQIAHLRTRLASLDCRSSCERRKTVCRIINCELRETIQKEIST